MLELAEPAIGLHSAWLASHREWGPGAHEDGFSIRSGDDLDDPQQFANWVTWLNEQPGHRWWIIEDHQIVGGIVLRPTAETNGHTTGHIGYGVAPSARGRGIASWALRQALTQAHQLGMPGCVLVCLDDNIGSIKTIERAGGTLTGRVHDDGQTVRHYWIPTKSEAEA